MDPTTARMSAVMAGAFTAAAGLMLLAAPEPVARWTGLRSTRPLLVTGLCDVVLAPGLMALPNKVPWLVARSVANVVSAAVLAAEPAPVPRAAAAALSALAVADLAAARSLHRHQTS